MIMSSKQKKLKFKPRIKLNYNMYMIEICSELPLSISPSLPRTVPNSAYSLSCVFYFLGEGWGIGSKQQCK